MIMNATVLRIQPGNLLVKEMRSGDEVIVHFRCADRFSPGDKVRITYDGKMTLSIPPQISAISIHPINLPDLPQATYSETRAVVLQRGRGFLLVRGLRDNRRMRVFYNYAHHFCVRQRIIIKHDSIIMNNPPEVNAIEIIPIC